MIKAKYQVTGMTCPNCERAVCQAVGRLPGVHEAQAGYQTGALVVESDGALKREDVKAALEAAGYGLAEEAGAKTDAVYLLVILVGLYVIANQLGLTALFGKFPVVDGAEVGYFALFIVGLLTSVHCIAMCGGVNLGQSMTPGKGAFKSSLLYNLGRLVSYTVIGGLLGALGGAVSITLGVRSVIGLLAGAFMVLMGVNMAGEFHFLRRLTPRLPAPVGRALAGVGRFGPFAIGLVNGLMPCGPLQSMQLYAITSGSFVRGALSMLCFCLGTIPLVLGVGVTARLLQIKWRRVMLKASAVLLMLFGLFMVQSNLALSGVSLPSGTASASDAAAVAVVEGNRQTVTTYLHANGYDDLTLYVGLPTEWTMIVEEGTLNGCNSEIVIPFAGLQVPLQQGENVIQLPALEPGSYAYSCWMGMLRNVITVTE